MTNPASTSPLNNTPPEPQENSIALNQRQKEAPTQADLIKEDALLSHMWNGGDGETYGEADEPKHKVQGMPETVSSRYLRIEDKYYLPDKTVAFVDHGNKLKLETENHSVIRDALAIAETRGWQSITVSGSQNFKHQVWREASMKGMVVVGYKPTELEQAELNHGMILREERQQAKENNRQQRQDGELHGVLVSHGADHYRHDPEQGKSYFVTLDVGDGKEVTLWGSDFKRAFADSQSKPQVGDAVVLSNKGKQDIELTSTVLDERGTPVEDKKTVQKNLWQIEKANHQENLEEQAEAIRADQEIERKVIAQMPQLAAALAVSKLGEKIAQQAKQSGALKSQDEVDTMVYLIREGLAAALEKGKHIKPVEIREQAQRAAVDANSIINDHKPPEITKEPLTQENVR